MAAAPTETERTIAPASVLAALGIVFGDLGTSPLYTLQTVAGEAGGGVTPDAALGALSLIVWALIVTVSVKYCLLVMRADNHGEGGILALMSLTSARLHGRGWWMAAAGLFGAALIYGDGVITPAISVLSALEGVNVATPVLKPYVLPAALVVLLALFAAQALGTARIGRVFGPVMLAWFTAIAVAGLVGVIRHPGVVAALDPRHGARFMLAHGWGGFTVLGGVFLAITGGEALYADMGHVGRAPIRFAWYGMVLPALLLSYAGQTALLMDAPDAGGNPFFRAVPGWAVWPMVVLATAATVIASQAIITGAFSLTRQAMQLGWLPGLNILQTSDTEYGQIYVPAVNWVMMGATLALTLAFRSSDRLAGAYGTAVSTTMLLTTLLLYQAMRRRWGWPAPVSLAIAGLFLVVDLAFFAANLLKIREGGWIPLLLGVALFVLMTTWRQGVEAFRQRLAPAPGEPEALLERLRAGGIPRVPGTAVFLTASSSAVPAVMLRHATQFGVLPEILVTLTVIFEEVPRMPAAERAEVEQVADGLWHVTVRFGFLEVPNLPMALACANEKSCPADLSEAMYFGLSDEVVRSRTRPRLAGWRRRLFSFMQRNAVHAVDRFDLPRDRFVEVGRQIGL